MSEYNEYIDYDYTNDDNIREETEEQEKNTTLPPLWNSKLAQKRKGISYSDILSSINMGVINGKIVLLSSKSPAFQTNNDSYIEGNEYSGNKINSYFRQNNSSLYYNNPMQSPYQNEYFQQEQEQSSLPPLTIQQKRAIYIQQYLRNKEAQKHISNTKPKKMYFGNSSFVSPSSTQNSASIIGMARPRPPMMKQFIFR